jgi:hypothetical protein
MSWVIDAFKHIPHFVANHTSMQPLRAVNYVSFFILHSFPRGEVCFGYYSSNSIEQGFVGLGYIYS